MEMIFFAGAPKCGTSTIYNCLKGREGIVVTEPKETHYFSYPEIQETYYKVPFVKTEKDYLASFSGRGDKFLDFSPSYFSYHSACMQRMLGFSKNAKVILILRDPVKRLLSHYYMDIRLGYKRGSVIDLINEDSACFREYVGCSLYSDALKAFKDGYGDNLKVYIFEKLFSCEDELRDLSKFLCLKNDLTIDELREKKSNIYSSPRSSRLNYFIRNNGFLMRLWMRSPFFLKKMIKSFFMDSDANPSTLTLDVYEELRSYFVEDIKLLSDQFPEILDFWKEK